VLFSYTLILFIVRVVGCGCVCIRTADAGVLTDDVGICYVVVVGYDVVDAV